MTEATPPAELATRLGSCSCSVGPGAGEASTTLPRLGIDVVDGGGPSHGATRRVGSVEEFRTFGLSSVFASKEAATKAIGGRPAGADLRDVHLVPVGRPCPRLRGALDDLWPVQDIVRGWTFEVSPHLARLVGERGGATAGCGVVAVHPSGPTVALAWGRPGRSLETPCQ